MNEIVERCRKAGIRLWVEGNTLRYDAPKGTVTPDLLAEFKANKAAVMAELRQPWKAKEAEDLKELFEERAGILEHGAGLPKPEAELEAARITATLARNRGYLWSSLRAALAGHPELLARVVGLRILLCRHRTGPVASLPFGPANLAVLKGRRVVRQGEFSGVQEVKA